MSESVPINVKNFIRAETDLYFGRTAKPGAFGTLRHRRAMASIDAQDVVRMNRDTLYSSGVFDLDAEPVAVTLPDPGERFMSLQVVSQDHFAIEVVYAPGRFSYSKETVGTRYVFLIIRTLANPEDPADLTAANALQDAIEVEQARAGSFEVPTWEIASQDKVRDALAALGSFGGTTIRFGTRDEVDPISHLIGTAIGWSGNPNSAAIYSGRYPAVNDGNTVHAITVKDVPVDGLVDQRVQRERVFREERPQCLFAEQPHGQSEPRWFVHRAVRGLQPGCLELPADHAGVELHRQAVSAAAGAPGRELAVPGGAAGEMTERDVECCQGRDRWWPGTTLHFSFVATVLDSSQPGASPCA
jgi:Protein of unknown function (DUF1254)